MTDFRTMSIDDLEAEGARLQRELDAVQAELTRRYADISARRTAAFAVKAKR
jgi:hypothetical protein